MDSVYNAKLPNAPSFTHINPSSFSFLYLSLPSVHHCSPAFLEHLLQFFFLPLSFLSSLHPSCPLFFHLFVQLWVSVREAQRVGMAAWHKHTRLPISPLGCLTGGVGNLYLVYILPHLTPSAFLLCVLFDAFIESTLQVQFCCSWGIIGIELLRIMPMKHKSIKAA